MSTLETIDEKRLYVVEEEDAKRELKTYDSDPSGWTIKLYVVEDYGDEPDFTGSLSDGDLTVDSNNTLFLEMSSSQIDDNLDTETYSYYIYVDDGTNNPFYDQRGDFIVQSKPVDK